MRRDVIPAGCVVCGYEIVHAKQRCHPCYRYLRRTGRDRSEEQVVKAEYRRILAELEALVWRSDRAS
jgi:hypothetical protein